MAIYERGRSYMVSVGGRHDRYRESFKSLDEAKREEAAAILRMKASGSPQKAPTSDDKAPVRGKVLRDAEREAWRVKWSQNRAQHAHTETLTVIYRTIPELTPLSEITDDTILDAIEEWEETLGNSGSTVNRKLSHLSVMLKVAVDKGWMDKLPKIPRRRDGKHRIRWMDKAEELRVLNMCTELGLDELRDFVVVAVDTGFRRSELLGLTPRDFFNGRLHLHAGETKSGHARSVPCTNRVIEVLTRRANQKRVFDLTVYSLRYQWRQLREALEMADDDQFVVHMMRHTCASRMVQKGVPLAVVKEWMGHSDIATTMRYAHLAPDSLNAGLAALNETPAPQLAVVNG